MTKPLYKLLFGIIVLLIFIFIGIPFEIEKPSTEAIFRTISFVLIFSILFLLFRQARKLNYRATRIVSYLVLGILSFLFIIGAMWNDILVGNPRGNWYNLEVYTNKSGTKILRQMRETSGSIYDYRDRLVIYEFDENNRISINTNLKNHRGPWDVVDKNSIAKRKTQ
jgi:hypothetical protein